MKKLAPVTLVSLTAVFALAGCGSSETTTAEVECLDVPAALQESIVSEPSGVAMEAVKASAVKSEEFPSMHLVALEFSASGGGNEVGVWATSDLDGGAPIMAVDGTAKSFTSWKESADSATPLNSTSAGVKESKACVSN